MTNAYDAFRKRTNKNSVFCFSTKHCRSQFSSAQKIIGRARATLIQQPNQKHFFKWLYKLNAIAVLVCCLNATAFAAPKLLVKILESQPHDTKTFTQGLIYTNGIIVESSGLYGQSFIRQYAADTGTILLEKQLPSAIFAEGIDTYADELLLLTWKSGILFRFNAKTLQLKQTQRYKGQGWGLAKIGNTLVMSNGSNTLSFRDPVTFKEIKRLDVTNNKVALNDINELEFDGKSLWANQWKTSTIYKIDHTTGKVVAEVSLDALVPEPEKMPHKMYLTELLMFPKNRRFG